VKTADRLTLRKTSETSSDLLVKESLFISNNKEIFLDVKSPGRQYVCHRTVEVV